MTTYVATVPRIPPVAVIPNRADAVWNKSQLLQIQHFRPEGSDHRPQTTLRLLHDNHSIYGLFQVQDRYVRCLYQNCGEPVYRDSCVEFFVLPKPGHGYFNFEFNCGGTMLCFYITDGTRTPNGGFKEACRLTATDLAAVRVSTSLPKKVEPEITEPTSWWLAFQLPVSVMEKFVGRIGALAGQVCRGNTYKCGSGTSHPHWAAWAPVDVLNFHLPRCFGELRFE